MANQCEVEGREKIKPEVETTRLRKALAESEQALAAARVTEAALRAQVEARGRFSDVILGKANGALDRVSQEKRRADDSLSVANQAIEHMRVLEARVAELEASEAALVKERDEWKREAASRQQESLSVQRDCFASTDRANTAEGALVEAVRRAEVAEARAAWLQAEFDAYDAEPGQPYADAKHRAFKCKMALRALGAAVDEEVSRG